MSDAEALTCDRTALGLFVVLCTLAYRSVFSGDQVDAIGADGQAWATH